MSQRISTAEKEKYVVNFLRDRDSYQVPAALHVNGKLSALITDLYYDNIPKTVRTAFNGISDHQNPKLSGARVFNSIAPTLLQAFDKMILRGRRDLSFVADTALDLRTANYVGKNGCSALLYSGYAEKTFEKMLDQDGRRFLFLFHPHHKLVSDILNGDAEIFPEFRSSFDQDRELTASWRHRRADRELDLAQAVLAASAFTVRSAHHYGFSGPVAHVPYFTEFPANKAATASRTSDTVRFLFVGQGIQRKGLHHLILAWKRANLTGATLTCICSRMHESISKAMPDDVIVKSGLSKDELIAEFDRAHAFVMPSLVEGFGLVYLEAMRRGAFVIGTDNTGLPDIGAPCTMARSVCTGSIEALTGALVDAYRSARSGDIDHDGIVAFSDTHNFNSYQHALINALKSLEASMENLS